jgi:hypothetical protein
MAGGERFDPTLGTLEAVAPVDMRWPRYLGKLDFRHALRARAEGPPWQ